MKDLLAAPGKEKHFLGVRRARKSLSLKKRLRRIACERRNDSHAYKPSHDYIKPGYADNKRVSLYFLRFAGFDLHLWTNGHCGDAAEGWIRKVVKKWEL